MIAAKAKTATSSCIHQTLAIFLLVVYYFCLINFFLYCLCLNLSFQGILFIIYNNY